MSKATPTTWKNKGTTPQAAQLQKIADYFGVSVDYLLGNTKQKEKPLVNEDEELTEYLDELKNRPEMKMLFSLAKGATKEDVEKAVRIAGSIAFKCLTGFTPAESRTSDIVPTECRTNARETVRKKTTTGATASAPARMKTGATSPKTPIG